MDHLHQRQCGFDAGERAEDTGAGCAEGMWTARTRVVDAEPMAAVTLECHDELRRNQDVEKEEEITHEQERRNRRGGVSEAEETGG